MALQYGFIGLGSMGYGMCTNIHSKIPSDAELFICDINKPVLDKFIAESIGTAKVTILDSPKDVTERSDVILTMLPKSEHVQHVFYASDNNILSADRSRVSSRDKKLFIECSTIDPSVSREVGAKIQESGLGDFSDAAVSGGPFGARDGTLTHMIGCDDSILDKVKAVVGMTGKQLFHCGAIGDGVSIKLINNYIAICSMLATSEGLNMGVKMGIDPKKLTDIISASSGQNWVISKNNPVPGVQPDSVASRGYKGGFAIELAAGCIDLALKGAEGVGAKMTLGPTLQNAYHEAMEDPRCKELDARSIYRWVSDTNAGAESGDAS